MMIWTYLAVEEEHGGAIRIRRGMKQG